MTAQTIDPGLQAVGAHRKWTLTKAGKEASLSIEKFEREGLNLRRTADRSGQGIEHQ